MKKILAIFLAVLMVSTSCVTFIAALDMTGGTGENWISVDGDSDTDHWYGTAVEGANFDYRINSDSTNLVLDWRTDDVLPETGSVFRFWLRDESDATVYTDFFTIQADSATTYSVAHAKLNTSKTENKGASWTDDNINKIDVDHTVADGYTTFTVTIPLSCFDGLVNQNQIDVWASYFVGTSTLHSGNALNQPHALWDSDEDDTIIVSVSNVNGTYLEAQWQNGWTIVDGVDNGQWQASDNCTVDSFKYDYKAYVSDGYLYVGVKYNKAPTFISDGQTTASNIRIWMTKDLMTTPTGSFGNLVDIRYDGTNAVIVAREDDLDRSAMLVSDTQTADSWSVEFAVPLSQLGFVDYKVGDYMGLTLTCSDPFETVAEGETAGYGALYSYNGFLYTDRTTANHFYFIDNSEVVYSENVPDITGYQKNVALNKDWSGIDYHDSAAAYTGDFTDGKFAAESAGFSYGDPWFSFYKNGEEANINDKYYGEVIIDLGNDGNGIGGVRMQVIPFNGATVKVYASNNKTTWDDVGDLNYSGDAIQWSELNFDKELDARYIKVGVQCVGMFFMVSEIQVIKYIPGTSFSVDFANQFNVGYQDGTTWVYNGGESLVGVGDASYVYTPSNGATIGEAASTGVVWWDVWVVDYDVANSTYFIKAFYPVSADSKANVAIPENGFAIAANGNGRLSIDDSLRTPLAIGAPVYVYDMDVQTLGVENTMDFVTINSIAVFTPTEGKTAFAPFLSGVRNESDAEKVAPNKGLEVLANGNKASDVTAFDNAEVVLFQNKVCETADTYPTVELILALDDVTSFNTLTLSFYHDYNSMIGLPKDNKITLSYANNLTSFTSLGDYTFTGEATDTTKGVLDAELKLGKVVTAKFVKISFAYGDSPSSFAPKVAWEFIGLTEIGVANNLPEGGLVIDNYAGYVGSTTAIMTRVGEKTTIGEVSELFQGKVKDYNYFHLIVVDGNGLVITVNHQIGRPDGIKDTTVIPEGGYLLLCSDVAGGEHTQAVIDSFKSVTVGSKITLYNVDLSQLAADAALADLTKAGFEVTGYEYNTGITNISDSGTVNVIKSVDLLTDGEKALDATAFSNEQVVLFQNKLCTTKEKYPTVDLLLKLSSSAMVNEVNLAFYHEYNSMIGLPKDNKVTISYATDPANFTSLGEFAFEGAAEEGKSGVIDAKIELGKTVVAKYIKISFAYGDSPFTTGENPKPVWEFVALTEVSTSCTMPELPTGAQVIDNFSKYVGSQTTIITRVDDKTTIGDITKVCANYTYDYNYFYLVLVNADNRVVAIDGTLGRPAGVKMNVVIPEGGYAILCNAAPGGTHDQAAIDAFYAINVGYKITLHNVDLEMLVNDKSATTLVNAGFSAEKDYLTGVTLESNRNQVVVNGGKALDVLSDGNKALDAATFSNAQVVLFTNKVCGTAGTYPTFDLVLALDTDTELDTVNLALYNEYSSMIGLPKDNKVTISYATDFNSFTSLGEFNFEGEAVTGMSGVIDAQFTLGQTITAKYIKVTFAFGDSPFAAQDKPVWEFVGLTEFGVSKVADPFELIDDAPIDVYDGFANGLTDGLTIEEIQAMFKGTVTVSGVGTGATITAGDKSITIIVRGDINGDGNIDAKDYMFAKRAFLETYTLTEIQEKAGCLKGTPLPTANDYMKIKRHFLGTYDIHAEIDE